MKRPLRRRGVMLAGLFLAVAFVVAFTARLPEPLGVDQGLFACFARWVPRGWLPYRDLFDTKPPLFLYWLGLAALVPDDLPRALWWLEGAWLVATLVVTFVLVSRRWGRAAGVTSAALLFAGMWSPGFGGFWSRVQADEILALPMLGSAWLALRSHARERLAFSAGLLAGACSLMKVPSLAIAAAWVVFYAWKVGGAGALRRTAWLLAGVSVPWAVAVAWFGAHGEITRLIGAVLVHQIAYAEIVASPWTSVVPELARRLLDVAALPLAAASLGLFMLARRGALEASWLATWLAMAVAAVAAQRQLAGYHYLLIVPPLAVAGGYGVASVLRGARRRGTPRARSLVALAALALLSLRAAHAWSIAYAPGVRYLAGAMSRHSYLREIQTGAFSMVTEEEVARVVRQETQPDEGVLVWAFSPGIYALADRHPATRYAFHRLMLTEAPLSMRVAGLGERRDELLRRLAVDPPGVVIVGHGDGSGHEPIDSEGTLRRFPELDALIARDYVVVRRVGRLTLYRRAR